MERDISRRNRERNTIVVIEVIDTGERRRKVVNKKNFGVTPEVFFYRHRHHAFD